MGEEAEVNTESTEEVLEETSEQQPEPESQQPELTQAEKKHLLAWKAKIDGEEVDVALTEDEIKRSYQKMIAADKRMHEAAQIKKAKESIENETRAFLKALLEDPEYILENHPLFAKKIDLDAIAEKRLYRKVQNEIKTPEQRELERLKAFEEEYLRRQQEQEQQASKQKQDEERAAIAKQAQDTMAKEFSEVLKSSNLPANERTIARMAFYMYGAIKSGKTEVTKEEIAEAVREDMMQDMQHLVSGVEPAQALKMLGEDNYNKLHRWKLDQIKGGNVSKTKTTATATKPKDRRSKYISPEEDRLKKYGHMYLFPDD